MVSITILCVDAYSCYTWICLLQFKSQVCYEMFSFVSKNQIGCVLHSLQSDKVKEFLFITLYLHDNGI